MAYFTWFLLIVIDISLPPAPFLSQGMQPPNIPQQTIQVPIAPGTNLQFQGPIQSPPPAQPPGQSRFFRHYHGGRR